MQSLQARVRNGRLVLDVPTALPEGEVVYLALVPATLGNGEPTATEPSPDAGDAEMAQLIDEMELLAELRSLS